MLSPNVAVSADFVHMGYSCVVVNVFCQRDSIETNSVTFAL